MTERVPKIAIAGVAIAAPAVLAYLAYSRPGYFTSNRNLGGLVLLEILIAAMCMYRRVFFPVVMVCFLLAGLNLPVGTGWAAARWVVLSVGAVVGVLIMVRERHFNVGFFHLVAFFAVLTSLISAAVSRYPDVALLKVLSMLLLFAYAGTGARIAVAGRENRFFRGLVVGCEAFVAANAILYALGIEAMGNPNSLGASMGVVAAPVLLWGVLLGEEPSVQRRRGFLYVVCMYLVFYSHARAGLAAACVSCGLLCLASRKYKLLAQGMVVGVILLAGASIFSPDSISYLASSVLYKNKEEGLLASRVSPWRTAVDTIQDHPWFGTGLGTTVSGNVAIEEQSKFTSSGRVTAENGSSYLSILVGVGLIGAFPLAILLWLLTRNVLRTLIWMHQFGRVSHPAIPLAMIIAGGILHAAFEDWMFAPGNYLCVFFWSVAFVLADVTPTLPRRGVRVPWHAGMTPQPFGEVAPNP